jgi:hypothetical protein
MSLREYVVTLYKYEDLESFYEDMETEGGSVYIPNRAVTLTSRRKNSRNTNYMLSDEEAELISQDSRVKSVVLSLKEIGAVIESFWTQSSTAWSKSTTVASNLKNWGLLRCIEGTQRVGWGSNGTANVSGTVTATASGKNVDVVIVDGHFNPGHPEFAVNTDGTGGSRVIQYNWFDLIPLVTGGAVDTYQYTPYIDPTYPDNDLDGLPDRTVNNDHGCHVAGTAVGNTQGWARDANIYNFSPYGSSPNAGHPDLNSDNFLEYIKVWHQTKPYNPETGIRNPTVTNHSYGINSRVNVSSITSVRYRGITYPGPFTGAQLLNYGIFNNGTVTSTPTRYTPIEEDMIDLIAAGVIVVGSSGNNYCKIAEFSSSASDDYNNFYTTASATYFYNRGSVTAADGVICVGAVGALINDSKLEMSNCGPRVDIYAPGANVMSSINSTLGAYSNDTRNSSFTLAKRTGTSMASPQVAGILACVMETWPRASQSQLLEHLNNYIKLGQMTETAGGPADYTDLQGSDNKFLFFFKSRPENGFVAPKHNLGNRPSSGMMYPRPKIFRYGS